MTSKFTKNHGSTYICGCCNKNTRETGYGESDLQLCKKCYVEGGLENEHSDNGGAHENVEVKNGIAYENDVACPTCVAEVEAAAKPNRYPVRRTDGRLVMVSVPEDE